MQIPHPQIPKRARQLQEPTIAAIHGNPVVFGDFHSAFHQSPMPSESKLVYHADGHHCRQKNYLAGQFPVAEADSGVFTITFRCGYRKFLCTSRTVT